MNLKVMIFLVCLMTFIACNRIVAGRPFDVVRSFYMNCNVGQYSQADSLLSTDGQKLIHSDLAALGGGIKGVCDNGTQNGTIIGVDLVSENIRGEGATVVVNIRFKNGTTKEHDSNSLIRENGSWKLTTD